MGMLANKLLWAGIECEMPFKKAVMARIDVYLRCHRSGRGRSQMVFAAQDSAFVCVSLLETQRSLSALSAVFIAFSGLYRLQRPLS